MSKIETVSERIIRKIQEKLESRGYEIALKSTFVNMGRLYIYTPKDTVKAFAEIGYDFQAENYTLTLTVNGKKISSQPGRSDYFDFYQAYFDESLFWDKLRINLPPV